MTLAIQISHLDKRFGVTHAVVRSSVPGRPALIDHINLHACEGEVVGIFGMIGSGALDLARSLFGVLPRQTSGSFSIRGRPVKVDSPGAAIRSGLAYLPSDRKRDGLIPSMPVSANLTFASLGLFTRLGIVNRAKELQFVRNYVSSLSIRCASPEQSIVGLSGGNQQKVMIAKWLLPEPSVFLFEEPTRGVDVGARLEVYRLINQLTTKGRAILFLLSYRRSLACQIECS